MMRECVDCHVEYEVGGLLASGGVCLPPGIETITPDWICGQCRRKYPEPVEYEVSCEECGGEGYLPHTSYCKGCDHTCEDMRACIMCDGEGSYTTHDCNPGCDHPTIAGTLPKGTVARGPIQFFTVD